MKPSMKIILYSELIEEILMEENIIQKEQELIRILVEEITKKKVATHSKDEGDVYDQALSYLSKHNMLLKDSVYPHLCSEQYK